MNIMREFTKKSLLFNKRRTVVTIIGVILSAAMLTAVPTFIASLINTLRNTAIEMSGNWHAEIRNVQMQNLSAVTGNGDVASTVVSRVLGSAELTGSQNEQKPYLYFCEYADNGFSQMSIRLKSGRLPQKSGEVVISETVLNSAGATYHVGDMLRVTLGHRETLDGKVIDGDNALVYQSSETDNTSILGEKFVPERTASFAIVGIMERPGFEYSWSAGCGVLGYLDKSALSPADMVDVFLTVRTVSGGIYKTLPAIAQQAGSTKSDIVYNDDLLRTYGVVNSDRILSFLFWFAAVIIAIIIVASVSLIYNAFAISVSERAKQLGLLSSIGATKRQKRASVYYEAFVVGIIGIPIGIAAGLAGIGITLAAIQPLIKDTLNTGSVSLSLVISPLAVAIAAILSAATIFISVYIPARRASKVTPIDAIRQAGEVKLTRRAVKTSGITRRLFGFEAEIALKNLKRSRKKYRATVVSLTISLVLFLTVSTYIGMMSSMYSSTEAGYNFDIAVTTTKNDVSALNAANDAIASMPHVAKSVQVTELSLPSKLAPAQLTDITKKFQEPGENDTYAFPFSVVILDSKSFAEYITATGGNPAAFADTKNPKAVLVNHGQEYFYDAQKKAYIKQSGNILALKSGDSVTLYNEDDSVAARIVVGGVTDARPAGTLIQGFGNATLVVSSDAADTLFSKDALKSAQHAIYLSTDDDQALEKQISSLPGAEANLRVFNIHSAARIEQNTKTFLGVFIYGFITLISLICIANIFNTVSTNIALRRKEFAMLRSVGMTPKSFNKMIRFESIFYGLKGLLYGLPISMVIAYLLFGMQQSVMGSVFMLSWRNYAFAVVMILVIVFVTMLYSTRKIKHENIIDALKEETF